METITLTQGQFALVDDCDFEKVNQFKWCAHKGLKNHTFYAYRNTPYVAGHRTQQLLHRFILGVDDSTIEVDHKNRDGLDCRRHNLRVATHSQNQGNRKLGDKSASGFKGVSWQDSQWVTRISINGKTKWLGYSNDKVTAAKKYDAAAIEAFGDFALTNEKLGLYQTAEAV